MSITEIEMKIRESVAKASRKHRESETLHFQHFQSLRPALPGPEKHRESETLHFQHFQSLRPALPGPEMCDSTATSTTSVPTPAADRPSIT